jgi:hypothetical protein
MPGSVSPVSEYRPDGDDGAEIQVDLGGGDLADADVFGPAGEDSPPLPDDDALLVKLDGETETLAAVAYADATARTAEPGERRLYARDSSGAQVAEVYMQGDGTVTVTGATGSTVEIAADGSISISGASVAFQTGIDLGAHFAALHTAIKAWSPAPNDGGAALKTLLGVSYIGQVPPGP